MSTFDVASSRIRYLFFERRALARQSSCFWPTEKLSSLSVISVSIPFCNYVTRILLILRSLSTLTAQEPTKAELKLRSRKGRCFVECFLWRGREFGGSQTSAVLENGGPAQEHCSPLFSRLILPQAILFWTKLEWLRISLLLSDQRFLFYLQTLSWKKCCWGSEANLSHTLRKDLITQEWDSLATLHDNFPPFRQLGFIFQAQLLNHSWF